MNGHTTQTRTHTESRNKYVPWPQQAFWVISFQLALYQWAFSGKRAMTPIVWYVEKGCFHSCCLCYNPKRYIVYIFIYIIERYIFLVFKIAKGSSEDLSMIPRPMAFNNDHTPTQAIANTSHRHHTNALSWFEYFVL